MNWMMTEFGQL